MACYCGDPADGERVFEPLRAFGAPILDAIQPMPFPIMQKLATESEQHIRWARALSDALKPHSSGGYLLNFLGGEETDAVRAAFGGNHARLVELKSHYDPTNFFSLNQNVLPAGLPSPAR
jgi:Berberine and berberine like